jgi:hypothetical protein
MASWTAHPDHQVSVDPRWGTTATTPPNMARPVLDPNSARLAYGNQPAMKSAPVTTAPMKPNTPLPATTFPTATTPPPAPMPAVATGNAPPPAAMAALPTVVTPRSEQPIMPVAHTTTSGTAETVVQANKVEAAKTKAAPTPPPAPTPTVQNSAPAEVKPSKPGAPLMRLVNTKRITLNFKVEDVGPSGLGGVELWYTQDTREWKKYDAPTQAQAYVIEVDEEGMYGFTLLAKSGIGIGKEPPAAGDQPQVWVVVDLTKPDVQLTEITPNNASKSQQVTIGWKAADANLGRTPITLSYAEKEDGPWKVIAANLENNGKYNWQPPTDLARVVVKVEATDLGGNVGKAQSQQSIMLDNAKPRVAIIGVEAAPSK